MSQQGQGSPRLIIRMNKRKAKRIYISRASKLELLTEKLLSGSGDYRYRKDEIFKRIKISTFVTLVMQVYSMKEMDGGIEIDDDDDYDSNLTSPSQAGNNHQSPVPSLAITEGGDIGDLTEISTSRSTLQSVIRGVGEYNINDPEDDDLSTPRSDPSSAVPYLLLDIRDQDDFEKCHIISAKNYPAAMLSRAVNNYTNDILNYRNKPGRLIVIYDEDERISTKAATTFAQRGFDNVFVLSGGLKVAAQKYPHSFITGTLPASCVPPQPPSFGRRKGNETPRQDIPASQDDFTPDDINRLRDLLDEALLPSDTGSRLNRATPRSHSNASVSSSRTSTSMSSVSSQPWR
ncbi:centrosomal protein of 41 kDa-like isoform X2 [Apostichopus japonicus]|uniref:centrosomal protein of 41 kDa-like isoform X2 n=1 Tax=Stichopus japonicus TaxID=307972 RepID=UPI003AB269FD